MSMLNLDVFVRGAADVERAQYEILGGLQKARLAFTQNEIYPHLSQLIQLFQHLRTIVDQSDGLKAARPKRISGLNLEEGKVVYEDRVVDGEHIAAVEDLIQWA